MGDSNVSFRELKDKERELIVKFLEKKGAKIEKENDVVVVNLPYPSADALSIGIELKYREDISAWSLNFDFRVPSCYGVYYETYKDHLKEYGRKLFQEIYREVNHLRREHTKLRKKMVKKYDVDVKYFDEKLVMENVSQEIKDFFKHADYEFSMENGYKEWVAKKDDWNRSELESIIPGLHFPRRFIGRPIEVTYKEGKLEMRPRE
jgi:hypothetical protein